MTSARFDDTSLVKVAAERRSCDAGDASVRERPRVVKTPLGLNASPTSDRADAAGSSGLHGDAAAARWLGTLRHRLHEARSSTGSTDHDRNELHHLQAPGRRSIREQRAASRRPGPGRQARPGRRTLTAAGLKTNAQFHRGSGRVPGRSSPHLQAMDAALLLHGPAQPGHSSSSEALAPDRHYCRRAGGRASDDAKARLAATEHRTGEDLPQLGPELDEEEVSGAMPLRTRLIRPSRQSDGSTLAISRLVSGSDRTPCGPGAWGASTPRCGATPIGRSQRLPAGHERGAFQGSSYSPHVAVARRAGRAPSLAPSARRIRGAPRSN